MQDLRRAARRTKSYLEVRLIRPYWVVEPRISDNARICFLASYTPNGRLSQHTLYLAKSWRQAGFCVVVVVAMDDPRKFVKENCLLQLLDGVLLRRNIGYDFGSWGAALRAIPTARNASLLVLANDSLYGPLDNFSTMLERVYKTSADIIGATDSYEISYHLQSYLMFYKPRALKSDAFERFWTPYRIGDRKETIRTGELPFLAHMQEDGLKVEALFPTDQSFSGNPTLVAWKKLVATGFPFIKIELLRDNPFDADLTGWDTFVFSRGYNPEFVRLHLGSLFERSAARESVTAKWW